MFRGASSKYFAFLNIGFNFVSHFIAIAENLLTIDDSLFRVANKFNEFISSHADI